MLCSFAAWLQIGGDANKVNISSEAAKLECIRISNADELGKAQGDSYLNRRLGQWIWAKD